ncbi:hypothetical protein QT972_16580 [Microcoleus sp. herbarium7]|uniref:hypothetical protein n=1 Tax=Microcoleus sp. herbarium7 TaxID=3055435 RepID=UPI002FD3A398
MAITDIIANAKQIREEADAAQARQQEQKRAIEQEHAEEAKAEFREHLGTDVQALFDQLDEKPRFYISLDYNVRCRFTIYHRIIELRIDGVALRHDRPEWVIGNEYNDRGVFQGCPLNWSRTYRTLCVRREDLATQLTLLILEIAEDHEQLLPKIEVEKAKLVKKAELDRQSEEYTALLANAVQQSVEQMDELITGLQTFSWAWPSDVAIPLYKIRWCVGAHRASDFEDAACDFEYESGWALSDAPDRAGYFTLLPEGGEKARKIQPVYLAEIECVQISDLSDVPAVLTEKINHEIAVIEVKVTDDYPCTSKHIVLPHHLPVAPESISVSTTTKTRTLELGVQPIIELRRAIDLAVCEPVSYAIKPAPF